jgi:hypothetical protein
MRRVRYSLNYRFMPKDAKWWRVGKIDPDRLQYKYRKTWYNMINRVPLYKKIGD